MEFKKVEHVTNDELRKMRSAQLRTRAVNILDEITLIAEKNGDKFIISEKVKEKLIQNFIGNGLREFEKMDKEFKETIKNSLENSK